MTVDINILNDYLEKGLVVKNDHPTLPLSIWNYSRTCQYEGNWDNITKMCRGLILDKEGNVVAKAFDKFFNYEELTLNDIPEESFEVFEKLDGSLGILFWYQGKWILASKGSFISDQAIKGREILNNKYNVEVLPKGYTTVVEIIYPENRIVCDYGEDEELVVLSMISNANGKELDYDSMLSINEVSGFPTIKKYDGITDYDALKSQINGNREGYVIRFKNGFRMKIKGEEYVRLHRILTGFSNVDIWEYLKDGKDLDELLDRVPDEFDLWVKNTVKDLNKQFWEIQSSSAGFVDNYRRTRSLAHIPFDKKEFAALVMTQPKTLRPIMFSMYDGKKYDEIIWKSLRPKYSKPFWQKEIEP
jgi:T4 RnlA family RNA ligase